MPFAPPRLMPIVMGLLIAVLLELREDLCSLSSMILAEGYGHDEEAWLSSLEPFSVDWSNCIGNTMSIPVAATIWGTQANPQKHMPFCSGMGLGARAEVGKGRFCQHPNRCRWSPQNAPLLGWLECRFGGSTPPQSPSESVHGISSQNLHDLVEF